MNQTAATKAVFCADIGTSSLKAALITTEGVLLAFARETYAGEAPYSWADALCRAAARMAAAKPGLTAGAAAISAAGPSLVAIAENGRALGTAHWFAKAAPLSGSSFFLPVLSAFRETHPSVFAASRVFFSAQEWLSWTLGAEPVTVLPHAAYEPFYWDLRQCAAAGFDPAAFPAFVSMGVCIGEVRRSALLLAVPNAEAAVFSILPEGTPIIGCGPDFIMALIGTGVLKPGMICDRAGSSEGINLCLEEKDFKRLRKNYSENGGSAIRLLPHAVEGLYNAGVVIPRSGSLFEEFRREQTRNDYKALMEEIVNNRKHPGRAVLQSMADGVKAALETLSVETGRNAGPLVVSGGQAKSRLWNQFKADLTGAELFVPEIPDGELTGGAVLGALYLEKNSSAPFDRRLRAAAERMVRIGEHFRPRT
jgi:sugar (pentulose or hexulose) kinase